MDIRYHGHSCFELSDGEARVLIDPFLKPNNPAAVVTAEEVDPTHILISHGHIDHMADAVPVATRTGAECVAIVEIANWLEEQGVDDDPRPEPGRHGQVRLGLGQARPGLAHEHDRRLRGGAVQPDAGDRGPAPRPGW